MQHRFPGLADAALPLSRTLACGLLVLLVTLPFLQPIHHQPIPSFYEEWWAFFLGTGAALAVTLFRPLTLAIPALIALPGFLLLLVLGQWLVGIVWYREATLFHAGYLAWGGMLLTLGATLRRQMGAASLSGMLSGAVLAGALLSAVLGVMQYTRFPLPDGMLFPALHGRATANLAQPNLLASYLWIGIAAAIYLTAQARLALRAALPVVAMLGFTAGLSGSRMAVLHGFLLLGIGLTVGRRWQPGGLRQRKLLLVAGLIALAAGAAVLSHWPMDGRADVSATVLDRLSPQSVCSDARLALWRDAVTLIGEHPWTGNGVGNFPWRSVEAAAQAPSGAITFPGAEHAHNALLQVAADFGLPALIVCLLLLWRWARAIKPDEGGVDQWAIDLLALLGLHSLLEYPLWNAEFLGLAALAAGALAAAPKLVVVPASRKVLPIALVGALLALLPLRLDYGALDEATNYPPQHHPSDSEWQQRIGVVAHLATHSGLGAYANIALGALLQPEKKLAREQSLVCERAMRLWPDPVIITHCAVLRLFTGKEREADALMTTLGRAFRDAKQRQAVADVLREAEIKNPEVHRLGVLWSRQNQLIPKPT